MIRPACGHVSDRRPDEQCPGEPVVVIDYAGGTGACSAHVTPVLLWCMGKNGRGQLPEYAVRVAPAWRWEEYERTAT